MFIKLSFNEFIFLHEYHMWSCTFLIRFSLICDCEIKPLSYSLPELVNDSRSFKSTWTESSLLDEWSSVEYVTGFFFNTIFLYKFTWLLVVTELSRIGVDGSIWNRLDQAIRYLFGNSNNNCCCFSNVFTL